MNLVYTSGQHTFCSLLCARLYDRHRGLKAIYSGIELMTLTGNRRESMCLPEGSPELEHGKENTHLGTGNSRAIWGNVLQCLGSVLWVAYFSLAFR